MSDTQHILYTVISFVITAVLIVLAVKYVKKEKTKNFLLKLSAILTVVLHFSILYVEYFTNDGIADIGLTYLMPAYPCHIAMWLLVIVTNMRDKKSTAFKVLSEITFYLGIIGGIVGILLNENYIANPNLADWGVLKGLLSHNTMLFGCIYLLAGGYMRIRVDNMPSVLIGLIMLVVDGYIVIGLHQAFGIDPPNSMYLLSPPIASLPWFNTWMLGIAAFFIIFGITALYEWLAIDKKARWDTKLKEYWAQKKGEVNK